MSTSQIRAVEDYSRLINRNAVVHAIRTAVDLGIWKELSIGQRTATQLVESLDLKPEPLQLLLNLLCETELLQKYGDDYALSTVARLIPELTRDLGDRYWQYLSATIRSGVRLPVDKEIPVSESDYFLQIAASEWTTTPAAMDAAEILEAGKTRTGLRILEIGCGGGVFGVAIAHRDPESRLVLLDDAANLKRAETTVNSVGLQGRTVLIEADYRANDLAEQLDSNPFDLLIVAGILHRHNLSNWSTLVKSFSPLIKPAGEIAVIDVFPGQEDGGRARAVFELELFLRTSTGQLHHPDNVKQTLDRNGYENIQFAPLKSPPNVWGMILANRI